VATKPKRYDLKAADRKRNVTIQIGLVLVVVVFAAAIAFFILSNKKPQSGEIKSIRVATSNVVKKEGSSDPKVVLSMYEDFLCPACGNFEKNFGPTVRKAIASGAIAGDYYMVSILDRQGDGYSSRASNAGYCVADQSTEVFQRFHDALYKQQPEEGVGPFPDNARLIEVARQAGVAPDKVSECINGGRYLKMAQGLAGATNVTSTPTIRINGEEYSPTTPDALVAKIKGIVGDVPGLEVVPPAQPPAGAPGQAPAGAPQAPTPGAAPAPQLPAAVPPSQPAVAPPAPVPTPTP
jgi:protein-disulfide isomerase